MTWFDVFFYGTPGLLAYAITAVIKRWFVPWSKKRWPARQGAFVDPDKYFARQRQRGEWD